MYMNRANWYDAGGWRRVVDRVFTDGFWALPGKADRLAAIAGLLVYLITAFLLSVWLEGAVMRSSTTGPSKQQVLFAHLLSYPVMIVTCVGLILIVSYAKS
jgi:hypothetical protein